MGLVFVLPVMAIALVLLRASWLRFRRPGLPASSRALFLVLLGGGLLAGVWLNFRFQHETGKDFRMEGAPIPLSISQKQEGGWVTRPLPGWLRPLALVTNFMSGAAALLVPWLGAQLLREWRESQDDPPLQRP